MVKLSFSSGGHAEITVNLEASQYKFRFVELYMKCTKDEPLRGCSDMFIFLHKTCTMQTLVWGISIITYAECKEVSC